MLLVGRLRILLRLHQYSRCAGPLTVRTNTTATHSAWEVLPGYKDQIGSRAMILTAQAPASHSPDIANKMSFALRQLGVQPVFCTMTTALPNISSIEDSADLYKRSGCKSIVAIGCAALMDYAKALRSMVECGARSIEEMSRIQSSTVTQSITSNIYTEVPLFAVATTLSPVHHHAEFATVHTEENVLLKLPACPPNVVVYDDELIVSSPYYNSDISNSYILSHIFDSLLCLTLHYHAMGSTGNKMLDILTTGPNAILPILIGSSGNTCLSMVQHQCKLASLEEPNGVNLEKLAKLLGNLPVEAVNSSTNSSKISGLVQLTNCAVVLRAIAVNVMSAKSTSNKQQTQLPFIIEPIASLAWLSAGSSGGSSYGSHQGNQRDWMVPYSYASVICFQDLLQVLQTYIGQNVTASSESIVEDDVTHACVKAVQILNILLSQSAKPPTTSTTKTLTNYTQSQHKTLEQVVALGVEAAKSTILRNPRSFVFGKENARRAVATAKTYAGVSGVELLHQAISNSNENISSAGLLESLIFVQEAIHSTAVESTLGKDIISDTAQTVPLPESPVLTVLRSDVVYDLVERVLSGE